MRTGSTPQNSDGKAYRIVGATPHLVGATHHLVAPQSLVSAISAGFGDGELFARQSDNLLPHVNLQADTPASWIVCRPGLLGKGYGGAEGKVGLLPSP